MEYLGKHWKTIAAFVYLFICVCDFVVYPTLLAIFRQEVMNNIMMLSKAKVPEQVLTELSRIGNSQNWVPFTLRGGGLFHLSFGAILTGSVLNKKKNK